jgi:hypothetical protein
VGASEWNYYVPYQENLGAALDHLRRKVFEAGDYWWVHGPQWGPVGQMEGRPQTIEELWEDEHVHTEGTHSILDIFRVIRPDEEPDYMTVKPISAAEAMEHLGVEKLTRAHVPKFDVFPRWRWYGRCAVLHDDNGQPQEIYFWGHSGD